jgi:heme-degrading monooxygenase HmoA
MVVRTWRGRAAPANQHAYVEHFRQNVLPELCRIEGFLEASLLKEDQTGVIEFLVITRWQSMDAIRAFAGNDVQRAVVEPAAVAALLDFDQTVRHYEVVEAASIASDP